MNQIELNELVDIAINIFNSPDTVLKKRGPGVYAKLTERVYEICNNIFQDADSSVEWNIELFKSTKPTGVHNDVNYDAQENSTCKKIMILPLTWNSLTAPTTIVFNESFPKKVFEGIDPNTFIDAETKLAIPSNLPNNFLLDELLYSEKLSHCVKSSLNGLTLKSIKTWEAGKPFSIESSLLHAAGYFKEGVDWKICVLGLGFKK